MPTVLRRTIPATTVGAYLVSAPEGARHAPLLVGFHGYGQNAEICLADLQRIPGSSAYVLVAVQALHRFYDRKQGDVVGSWMTSADREQAIADNERYVASVVAAVAGDGAGDGRIVYLGFSQGTSMAYRAAARGVPPALGVIALCGDLPPDVGDDGDATLPRVLIGHGATDTWYTKERLALDLATLRGRGTEVEVCAFEGGHAWTEQFREAAGAFLRDVAPTSE
jgi:predicted esterase